MSTPDIDEQPSPTGSHVTDGLKDDVSPSSATLFVANLDLQATNDEINSVFRRLMRMRMRERERERERLI